MRVKSDTKYLKLQLIKLAILSYHPLILLFATLIINRQFKFQWKVFSSQKLYFDLIPKEIINSCLQTFLKVTKRYQQDQVEQLYKTL